MASNQSNNEYSHQLPAQGDAVPCACVRIRNAIMRMHAGIMYANSVDASAHMHACIYMPGPDHALGAICLTMHDIYNEVCRL